MSIKNKIKLNGGEFLLRESLSNEIFTPEDFSQEQLMMKETIIDFMNREIWPDKMKYEEISDVLGTSIGALKANYHHAQNKIKEFLKSN